MAVGSLDCATKVRFGPLRGMLAVFLSEISGEGSGQLDWARDFWQLYWRHGLVLRGRERVGGKLRTLYLVHLHVPKGYLNLAICPFPVAVWDRRDSAHLGLYMLWFSCGSSVDI